MEMIRAEDLKFEIFNSLNSTDDFDITCEMYAPTGSRISRRVCDVGYMKKAREEDVSPLHGRHIYLMLRSDHQLAEEFAHKAEAMKKGNGRTGQQASISGKSNDK
jgi:hypothetical protein